MSSTTTVRQLQAEGCLAGLSTQLAGQALRLRGHASTRRFFRVDHARGTAVLVVYPADLIDGPGRYVATASWFADAGVRVPRILDVGERSLLVEDAGDRLLDTVTTEPERTLAYRQAIDVLERLQRHGRRAPPANPGWALDAARLRRELEFTEEHALRGWLGAGPAARGPFYDRLAAAVQGLPTAACHRDFHARNLLVRDGRLVVLDFQDVMAGPFLYDLASLLWDNYCDMSETIRREIAARFWRACGTDPGVARGADLAGLPLGMPAPARQAFCLVGLQRSLKALGTFGYQVTRAGNVDYAVYAPRTWRHARSALLQLGWDDMLAALQPLDRLLHDTA